MKKIIAIAFAALAICASAIDDNGNMSGGAYAFTNATNCSWCNALGGLALANSYNMSRCNAYGLRALSDSSDCSYCEVVGANAMRGAQWCHDCVSLGRESMRQSYFMSNCVVIGSNAAKGFYNCTNSVFINSGSPSSIHDVEGGFFVNSTPSAGEKMNVCGVLTRDDKNVTIGLPNFSFISFNRDEDADFNNTHIRAPVTIGDMQGSGVGISEDGITCTGASVSYIYCQNVTATSEIKSPEFYAENMGVKYIGSDDYIALAVENGSLVVKVNGTAIGKVTLTPMN